MLKRTTAVVGCLIAGAIGFLGVRTKASAAETYSFLTLDVPNSSLTAANGVDVLGRIVGYYEDGEGTHGFVFSKGEFSPVDYPGAQWTAAFGINSQGQIVGAYGPDAVSGRHGFLLSNGRFSSIDVPGSSDTVARGVSNQGQIVGDYAGSDGSRHGFLLSAGAYNTVEVPKSEGGAAGGINDSGQIAGRAGAGATTTGFLFSAGQFGRIHAPESNYSEAWGVNNRGDVVGQAGGPEPPHRGFRVVSGTYLTLELPGVPFSWDARGINDLGEIVGAFTDNDGKTHGYRATPAALKEGPMDSRLSEVLGGGVKSGAVAAGGAGAAGAGAGVFEAADGSGKPAKSGTSSGAGETFVADAPSRGPQSPALLALAEVLSNLESASTSLVRAQNQSPCVKESVSKIGVAVSTVRDVIGFIDANSGNGAAAARLASASPDFSPPPKRFSSSNTSLYNALESLRVAFNKLDQTPGSDWGGLRAKLNAAIGAAAVTLRPCIIDGNRIFEEQRGGRRGDSAPATSTSETKRNVESALSNLESAAGALRRAQNQSECVKASASKIDVAVSSVKDVIRVVDANGGNGSAAVPPAGDSPDFMPPPRRNANSNTNLYNALASLRAAFEKLAQAAGGDWGGLRGKLNADIGAAVTTLRPCIVEGNRIFDERRGGRGRGEPAPSTSTPEPGDR